MDKRTGAVAGSCQADLDMVAWGRGLSVASLQAEQGDLAALVLPCVTLRWVITSSALEMKDSTRMVGSGSEFCCEAHFSRRFPDLHTAPTQLGRAVRVSSNSHLAFDFWHGAVTVRDKLLCFPNRMKLLLCGGGKKAHKSG